MKAARACAILALLAAGAGAREATGWNRAATPHFEIFSNAHPETLRSLALNLERLHAFILRQVGIGPRAHREIRVIAFASRAGVQPVSFEAGRGRLLHRRRRPRLYRDAGRTARRSARGGPRVRARPDPQRRLDAARVDRRRHRRRRLHRAAARPRDPHRRRSAGPLASPQKRQVDDPPRPFRLQPEGSVRRRPRRGHLLRAKLGARRSAHALALLSAGVSHAARRSRLGRTGGARSGRRLSHAALSRRA